MIHIDLTKITTNKPPIFVQHEKGAVLDVKLTDNGEFVNVDDLVLVALDEAKSYRLQGEGADGIYQIVMDELLTETSGTLLCRLTFKKGDKEAVTGQFSIFITPNNVKYEAIIPETLYFELGVVGYGKVGVSVVGKVLEV